MNIELITKLLLIAIGGGFIATLFIQRVKEILTIKNKKVLGVTSMSLSMLIGIVFSLSFSDVSIEQSTWVGLFTVVGAQSLYKSFEGQFGLGSIEKKEGK